MIEHNLDALKTAEYFIRPVLEGGVNMIDIASIRSELVRAGFSKQHETKKVEQFTRGHDVIYIKKPTSGKRTISAPLVIDGRHAHRLMDFQKISGVVRNKGDHVPYHNGNMSSFDLRQNSGQKPTRFGYDFDFMMIESIREFLNEI